MGMFDVVRLHPKHVPAGVVLDPRDGEWQTKDLECDLLVYEIDEAGRLFNLPRRWDEASETFAPDGATRVPVAHSGVMFLIGRLVTEGGGRDWADLRLEFDAGQMTSVRRCGLTFEDSAW